MVRWSDRLLKESPRVGSVRSATDLGWRILLPSRLRQQALDSVSSIARDLCAGDNPVSSGIESIWDHSLGYGSAGIALFFHYLHLSETDPGAANWRDRFMSASTRAVARQRMPCDLYRGIAGVAWSWKHIHRNLSDEKTAAAWAEIDQTLQAWMQLRTTPAELFEGAGGLCLYLAESRGAQAEELLGLILSKLERDAQRFPAGVAFLMSPAMRRHWVSNFGQEPTNVWKISVAHGSVGCLGGLAAALTFDSCHERSVRLLKAGVEWVWSHQSNGLRAFPEMVGADLPSRTGGWCNGDLGIALVLCQIARRLNRADWLDRSLAIARSEAAVRIDSVEENNRDNYCLCHGHAGRGHIFNRLYQFTGEDCFVEAAIYWFEQCLALRTSGAGIGGFQLQEGFGREPKSTRGFLMGASGLGLALLAAATSVPPEWDRLLLASTS
jgi:lantibiotic biosynthesis protein